MVFVIFLSLVLRTHIDIMKIRYTPLTQAIHLNKCNLREYGDVFHNITFANKGKLIIFIQSMIRRLGMF